MLKLDAYEMRRILRLSLARDELQLAELMRKIFNLGLDEWPQDKLLEHTRRGLDRAIAHNLTVGQDITRFLVMRHQFGERFDEFPAVRKFLARKDLPVDDRIEMMMLTLPPLIWDVVKRRTPPGPSEPMRAGFPA
jgi:hypothetical protein